MSSRSLTAATATIGNTWFVVMLSTIAAQQTTQASVAQVARQQTLLRSIKWVIVRPETIVIGVSDMDWPTGIAFIGAFIMILICLPSISGKNHP